jgi:beta-galactosidase
VRVYETRAGATASGALIQAKLAISAVFIQRIITIDAAFQVSPEGAISIKLDCVRDPAFPFLPRFGLRFFLPPSMDALEYAGWGPGESYIDKHSASRFGVYRSGLAAQHEDYIKPQENGSHWDCDWVKLSGKQGCGLSVYSVSRPGFCFNASPYTQEELTAKAHNFELEKSPWTVLCIDYAQSGLGSNSCGPALEKQYRLDAERFTFSLHLEPEH